ncbi:hypothetical protein F5Y12DRAFT_715216 [Xylaria sp. FL1777]|nr:hypothetical protein F5Y12DRAFT_715216 [Xylaria sp. FL1777]
MRALGVSLSLLALRWSRLVQASIPPTVTKYGVNIANAPAGVPAFAVRHHHSGMFPGRETQPITGNITASAVLWRSATAVGDG